mmetsp:Transcript_220/g.694  ORF Transcript_220/g.694 Transcript_220/m.694 type:complete len:142 (+) Transcript_220:367-792(+)
MDGRSKKQDTAERKEYAKYCDFLPVIPAGITARCLVCVYTSRIPQEYGICAPSPTNADTSLSTTTTAASICFALSSSSTTTVPATNADPNTANVVHSTSTLLTSVPSVDTTVLLTYLYYCLLYSNVVDSATADTLFDSTMT